MNPSLSHEARRWGSSATRIWNARRSSPTAGGLSDRIEIVGVDLIGMFDPIDAGLGCPRLVEASLSTWSPTRSFDLITCVHGLHYVGDKLGLICRAISRLKDDGLFVANLDMNNVKLADRSVAGRWGGGEVRRCGLEHDRRRRLVMYRGKRAMRPPFLYLEADDAAGPNDTEQPAVDSYYLRIRGDTAPTLDPT